MKLLLLLFFFFLRLHGRETKKSPRKVSHDYQEEEAIMNVTALSAHTRLQQRNHADVDAVGLGVGIKPRDDGNNSNSSSS